MTRRAGLTTTECLVALFIMALGVMAILTMFPLGMLNMGQALRDDRTAQCAINADGYMRPYWKTFVVENQTDTNLSGVGSAFDPTNSIPGTEPSIPVFVDPIGVEAQNPPGTFATFVGGSTAVPRRTLTLIGNGSNRQSMAIATCTMTDGLTYGMNGNADTTTTGGLVERDMRYNWLWVLQRPVNKNRNEVAMQVVVFERRAPRFYAANQEVVFPNGTYPALITMNPNTTSLTLPLTSGVQKGSWIMDATNSGSMRHAIFYRVASASDAGGGNLNVELDTVIRRGDGGSGAFSATIVVMTGVADVFTRPNLTP
jgi:hypothetical protein